MRTPPSVLGLLAAGVGMTLAVYAVFVYNALVRGRNDADKAWGNVDVLLRQRHDEVPNLVAIVRGYAAHERGALEVLTKARAEALTATDAPRQGDAERALTGAVRDVLALAEAYPDLKADAPFLALQRRLTGLEHEIADRRELYNDAVTHYNTRIVSFPDVLVATLTRHRERLPLFQARDADRKTPPADPFVT